MSSSRKEEERNEKIIRGLMKLPPNRRCINCNILGPQYVCTTFWTFVCITCSGIHREFTHRVKSVSMAKFTSQEVEALQKGGNQRAREIYFKEWDSQRLRIPDNSNADKIREFIKNVYVDKKFSGGKLTDKPPRDSQKPSSHEEDTRRASSYHSYSQSPPYDFQYEERRYGRHAPVLSRKPGSDRGLYNGKFSSFSSPSHVSEDGFANEQSNSRISNCSASSGGDPFRSGIQSPNFQKDIGSPSSETSRALSGEEVGNYTGNAYTDLYASRDGVRMLPRPQRTASSGSFGSLDSNSLSSKSMNYAGSVDVAPEHEQPVEAHFNNTSAFASLPKSAVSGNSDNLDLFSLPFAPKDVTATASSWDISKVPGKSDSLDLFSSSNEPESVTFSASTPNLSHITELSSAQSLELFEPSISTMPTFVSRQLPQTIPSSSLDLFAEMNQEQLASTFSEKSSGGLVPQNEGWATFDVPQLSGPMATHNSASATIPSSSDNPVTDPFVSLDKWPSFQDITTHTPSSAQTAWNGALGSVETMTNTPWNAFEDSSEQLPSQDVPKSSTQDALSQPSTSDQFLSLSVPEEFNGSQSVAVTSVHPLPGLSSHTPDDLTTPSAPGMYSYSVDCKSINPFELPYDPAIECGDTSQLWDMSSLQAALPNGQDRTSFTSSPNQPWFHQDSMTHYGSEGALGFMAVQASNTHGPTVPSQGPIAFVGGNPFA